MANEYSNMSVQTSTNPVIRDSEDEPVGFGVILDEDPNITNEDNLNLEKEIYGKKTYSSNLDINFKELSKKQQKIDVSELFQLYDQLFYNVPKTGELSHTTLAQRSMDYIGDFQTDDEAEIQRLIKEIQRLEEELAAANKQEEIEPEHPFFPNKSFIKAPNSNTTYYMEKAKKRKITSTDMLNILKRLGGYLIDAPFNEFAIEVPQSTIQAIPSGPPFSVEDLDGLANDRQQIVKQIITLDPTEDAAIKGGWPGEWAETPEGIDGYIKVVGKEWEEAQKVRRYLGSKIVEYNDERRNRQQYGITAEENQQLVELQSFTLDEIRKSEEKIAKYAALYKDALNIKQGIERDIEIAAAEAAAAAKAERDKEINDFLEDMKVRFNQTWNYYSEPEENLTDFFQDMKDRFGQDFLSIAEFLEFLNDPILSDPFGDYDKDGITNKLEIELGFAPDNPNETPIITNNSDLNTILADKKCKYYLPQYKGRPIYRVDNPRKLSAGLDGKFVVHYRTTSVGFGPFKLRTVYFMELEGGQRYNHKPRKQFYRDTTRIYN